MQIQAVNRRAMEKYREFVSAMDMVLESFDSLDAVIAKVDPKSAAGGWTVATQKELHGYRVRAFEELERLRTIAKKYEAELISREWRI